MPMYAAYDAGGDGPPRPELNSTSCATAWLPLVDAPPTSGTLLFAEGSHLSGEASPSFEDADVREAYRIAGGGAVRAGDVSFHSGWTIHGAGPNQSASDREAIAVVYVAKDKAKSLYTSEQRRKYEVCDFACRFDRREA